MLHPMELGSLSSAHLSPFFFEEIKGCLTSSATWALLPNASGRKF